MSYELPSTIIRQLTIAHITNAHNPIIEWFNDLTINLSFTQIDVFQKDKGCEYIYFTNDPKQWIFYYDELRELFFCNYDNFWWILEKRFTKFYTTTLEVGSFLVYNMFTHKTTSIPTSISAFVPGTLEEKIQHCLLYTDKKMHCNEYNPIMIKWV